MTPKLPPLPALPRAEVEEWSESGITFRGEGWTKETVEKYATDYALTAVKAQGVSDKTSAAYQQLYTKWRNGRQELANLSRAHKLLKEQIASAPPAPQAKPLSDEQQIAKALQRHGLTLVKTASGYGVMKLGECTAHGIKD